MQFINLEEIPFLDKPIYRVSGGKVSLFKSTYIDPEIIKEEVKNSSVWKRFNELTRIEVSKMERPPLPLHSGHIGLLSKIYHINDTRGKEWGLEQ